MATLYIIGNGFDLHHGLPTRYSDFKKWLLMRDPQSVEIIEDIYGDEDFPCWRDFEAALGRPNAMAFEAWHRRLTKEFITIMFVDDPISLFREWAVSLLNITLDYHTKDSTLKTLFGEHDLFLSFNYTPTLEWVYDVDPKRVCHIHGENTRMLFGWEKDDLVVGHAEMAIPPAPIWGGEKDRDLLKIFNKTAKPSTMVVNTVLKPFIDNNAFGIQRVVVMGSSISDADLLYFSFLIERLWAREWVLYCFDADKPEKERFAEKYLMPKGIQVAFCSW